MSFYLLLCTWAIPWPFINIFFCLFFSPSDISTRCHAANLNGLYYKKGTYSGPFDNGVVWSTWRGLWYSLKYTAMKIRFQSFLDGESGNGEINWDLFRHIWEREAGMPKLLYMWSLAWDLAHWKNLNSKEHATARRKIRFCFGLPIIALFLYPVLFF